MRCGRMRVLREEAGGVEGVWCGRMRVLREEAGGVVVCGVLIGVEGGLGRVHSGTAVAAQAEGRESGRWERHCTFYSPLYSY